METLARTAATAAGGALIAAALAACGAGDATPQAATTITATVTETVTVTAAPTEPAPSFSETPTITPSTSPDSTAADTGTFGPWSAPTTPGVSVVAQGWKEDDGITYGGVVFYNNGPYLSSFDASVQAKVAGTVADSTSCPLLQVPPQAFFACEMAFLDLAPTATFEVVGIEEDPDNYDNVDLSAGGITVTAKLPRARNTYGNVEITLTNPESLPLPKDSPVNVLVLDSNGDIVSSSESYTSLPVPPGESVTDVSTDVWLPAGSASVVASVEHIYYGDDN